MELLRIVADGLPLFKDRLDLTFYAQQRVAEEHKCALRHLFSNVYLNTANAFIGVNASGKTSVLRLISFVLDLIGSKPINHSETKSILGKTERAKFEIYFYTKSVKEICKLQTEIETRENNYVITKETLWTKSEKEITTRKRLLDFEHKEPYIIRNTAEMFLSDDVSITIAYNKKAKEMFSVANLLALTNFNVLLLPEVVPPEVISFLDPAVERVSYDTNGEKNLVHLKFYGKDELILNSHLELTDYLSSGTIKGMMVFTLARHILRLGGYLIVDEIENHFNREIVVTLLRFFMDQNINKNGAVLFFSTHYPDLLDEYERNDGIFITRNRGGVTVENLSAILKRNDIKKSEAYQSGFLEGTTPFYDAYTALKKNMMAAVTQERV